MRGLPGPEAVEPDICSIFVFDEKAPEPVSKTYREARSGYFVSDDRSPGRRFTPSSWPRRSVGRRPPCARRSRPNQQKLQSRHSYFQGARMAIQISRSRCAYTRQYSAPGAMRALVSVNPGEIGPFVPFYQNLRQIVQPRLQCHFTVGHFGL